MSDEEWADLRENVIYYYSRNEVEFIENQVEKMRKHQAQNTARANTVDLENRDRPEAPYVVKGLVPSGVPLWMVGVKMAGETLSAIDLGCRLSRR